MHKLSGSSGVCLEMQKFQCWSTSKVLHYVQLKFDFSDIFLRFLSKTGAKVFQSLVMLALRKLKNYNSNVFLGGLHDGAIRFEMFLLG